MVGALTATKMKDGALSKRGTAVVWAGLVALGLLGLSFGVAMSLRAQEGAGETNSQSGQVVTAHLDYQELNYNYINWGVPVTARSEPFKKEPSPDVGKLTRGLLRFGDTTTNEMAFAWDRSSRRLYLDLNRNLDLTDDPAGVFTCRSGARDYYQTFTNIHLPFKTPVGERQVLVDLNIYNYRALSCSAAARSLWQGKVTLQGEDWQVGLLPNPFGRGAPMESGNMLLRPWSERNRSFGLYGGGLDAFTFPRKLFFGDTAYEVRCTNEVQGDVARMGVEFAEQQAKLGELRITGESVERVMLEGGGYRVVLHKPGAVVRVPAGRYTSARVCLQKGGTQAYWDERSQGARRLTVSEQAPAVLTAGGPLTNSVTVSRRGKNLSLSYQMVGAGGVYAMVNQDRSHPPEFTVYQGDKKVASGKFQFG